MTKRIQKLVEGLRQEVSFSTGPRAQKPANLQKDLATLKQVAEKAAGIYGPEVARALGQLYVAATMILKGVSGAQARAEKAWSALDHSKHQLVPRTVIDLVTGRREDPEGA